MTTKTMTIVGREADGRGRIFFSLSDAISDLKGRWRRERQMRDALAELEQFDEHSLTDIGLNRYDLEETLRAASDGRAGQ